MHIYKYLFIYARLWVQPLFLVLIVRAASFFMHKNIGVIILHGHMCVSAFTCAHKIMHAHTNTYTYMQIQQVRAHACVHCKTLQNFAMHSKYHHGGIMLYTLCRIALHSCIHTSIHAYIYTLHCLYYIKQDYTVHRTEHYNTCQYNTLQPTTWMHISLSAGQVCLQPSDEDAPSSTAMQADCLQLPENPGLPLMWGCRCANICWKGAERLNMDLRMHQQQLQELCHANYPYRLGWSWLAYKHASRARNFRSGSCSLRSTNSWRRRSIPVGGNRPGMAMRCRMCIHCFQVSILYIHECMYACMHAHLRYFILRYITLHYIALRYVASWCITVYALPAVRSIHTTIPGRARPPGRKFWEQTKDCKRLTKMEVVRFTDDWAHGSCDANELTWNQRHERMNEWTNEWQKDCRKKGKIEWLSQRKKESVHEWMCEWMNAWMRNECMNEGWKEGRKESMHQWVHASMNHWISDWMTEWINESMSQWINERFNDNEPMDLIDPLLLWATTLSQLLLCWATTSAASATQFFLSRCRYQSPLVLPGRVHPGK